MAHVHSARGPKSCEACQRLAKLMRVLNKAAAVELR